jgi:hypothetical protein
MKKSELYLNESDKKKFMKAIDSGKAQIVEDDLNLQNAIEILLTSEQHEVNTPPHGFLVQEG